MQLKRLIEGSNVAYGTNQSFEVLDTKKTAGDAFFSSKGLSHHCINTAKLSVITTTDLPWACAS